MIDYKKRAFEMMTVAIPASGFRPSTPEEWSNLQEATIEVQAAMYRDFGLSEIEARKIANQVFGGPIGLLILNLFFKEYSNEQ